MREGSLRRPSAFQRAVILTGFFLLFAFQATLYIHTILNPDLGYHLAAGERILESGEVPDKALFSYTYPEQPWVDLHWGFQVLLSLAYRAAGITGLTVFQLFFGLTALALFVSYSRREAAPAAILFFFAFAVALSTERFHERPEIMSLTLLAAEWYVLARFRAGSDRALLWLPAIHAVWVNCHGLFVLGLFLIGAFWLGEVAALVLARIRPGLTPEPIAPRRLARLALAGAAAGLASLASPYGIHGLKQPLVLYQTLTQHGGVYSMNISELWSAVGIFTDGPVYPVDYLFMLYAPAIVLLVVLGFRRLTPGFVLAVGGFLYLALIARRNFPLFAFTGASLGSIAATDLAARIGRRLPKRQRQVARHLLGAAAVLLLLFGIEEVVTSRFYVRSRYVHRFGQGMSKAALPVDLTEFLVRHRLPGPIFNDFNFGGYFIWRAPGYPVYIDGRTDCYPPAFFEDYIEMGGDIERFERAREKYGFRTVAIAHLSVIAYNVRGHLIDDPHWRLVYFDQAGAIFTEESPDLELPRVDLASLPDPPPAPERSFWRPLYPNGLIVMGNALAEMGYLESAEKCYERALEWDPEMVDVLVALAAISEARGDLARAYRLMEQAFAIDPDNDEVLFNLGAYWLTQNNFPEAERYFELAEKANPKDAATYYYLGMLRRERGDEAGAYEALKRARKLQGTIDDGLTRAIEEEMKTFPTPRP